MGRSGRPPVMTAQQRKAAIFSAAEALLGAHRYETVTMADIAASAGMSKRTLYREFADKHELLRELIASSYVWPEDAFAPSCADPVEELRLRLRVMVDHVLSDRHIRLCRLAIGEGNKGPSGLAEAFLAMGIGRSRQLLIQAVARIPRERQGTDLPPETIAAMLYGATCGSRLMNALLSGRPPDIGEARATIEAVMAAVFVRHE